MLVTPTSWGKGVVRVQHGASAWVRVGAITAFGDKLQEDVSKCVGVH